MKKFFVILGLFLLAAPAVARGATTTSLLDKIQSLIGEESTVTDRVAAFTATTLNGAKLSYVDSSTPLSLKADDVKQALAREKNGVTPDKLCTDQKLKTTLACLLLMNDMQKIADREMETTRLGDRLQAIATSYENPISDFSLEPRKLTSAYGETLNVWGIPQIAQHPEFTVRLMPAPSSIAPLIEPLNASLDAITKKGGDEERTAAVWRYMYGLNFVESKSNQTNPDDESGDDTERRLLFKRWENDIESQLKKIRDALPSSIDPPLSKGEVAFFLLPLDTTGASNVTVWAYVRDTSIDSTVKTSNLPASDIGLRWETALKPILPALMNGENAIPGGRYPPPPAKDAKGDILEKGGAGLCESLDGSQGYLCRARTTLSAKDNCQESAPSAVEGTIILSTCTPKTNATDTGSSLTNYCADLRKRLGGTQDICSPGSSATYPYSILGDACFVRECAERSNGHRIAPGRIPLVSQETTAPWSGCAVKVPDPKKTEVSPLVTLPTIPEYNPAQRLQELNTQYCQSNGKPALGLPVLCGPDLSTAIEYPHMQGAENGFLPTQTTDPLLMDDLRQQAEAMGLERGAALYRDYLDQANATFSGNLRATVASLKTLASSTFPTAMCPVDVRDDRAVCSSSSAATPSP